MACLVWNFYTREKTIGRGNFGEIIAARHKTLNTPVAIKLASTAQQIGVLRHEFEHLKECNENGIPGIVALADGAMYATEDGGACIVLELAQTDLMTYVSSKSMLLIEVRFVTQQLLLTLHNLHNNGLVHRDVKPQNILVFPPADEDSTVQVKLADFGLAKQVDFARQNSAGDWGVMAPDVVKQTQCGRVVTPDQYKKSDVYAVGQILFFLLTGRPPFDPGEDREQLGDDFPFANPRSADAVRNAHPDAIDLCRSILRYRYFERPDAVTALQHRWLVNRDASPTEEPDSALTIPTTTSTFSEEHFDTTSPKVPEGEDDDTG